MHDETAAAGMRRRRRSFEQNCKDNLSKDFYHYNFGSREIVVHHNITFASVVLLKNSAAALQHHLCPSHKPNKKQPTLKNTEKQREREWRLGQKDEHTIIAHRTGSDSGFKNKGVRKEYII